MRHLFCFSIIVGCLAASLAFSSDQTQEKVSPQQVAELLEKLGSPKFALREQAMKELDTIGVAALPMLRPALKSADAEVRRRVEILVRKFEDMELTTKLLTAKMVRLNLKDATVAEAAAELAKQSYPVEVPPMIFNSSASRVTVPDIKITLDTDDTTFWQALHQIGMKTELSEGLIIQPNWTKVPVSPATIPVGKFATNPVCFAGSLRIMLVKTSPQLAAGIDLVLEVTCEPHLLDLVSAAAPTLDKAVDEQGQKLTASLVPVPIAPVKAAAAANIMIARAAIPSPMASQPRSGFQSFQVTMRLSHPAKPSKTLKEISGKIPVQTTLESEPHLVVDNILKAAGQAAIAGKDGKKMRVLDVEQSAKGAVTVTVRTDMPMPQNPGQVQLAARVQQLQAQVQIQAQVIQNAKANGNNAVVGNIAGAFGDVASPLRLLDAAGKNFTQTALPSSSLSFDGQTLVQTETVVFTPQAGQGAAAKLVLPGYRPFCFEVPFSFKDVELQ